MLERRAGEDNFKRLQQRLLAVSQNAAATGKGTSTILSHAVGVPRKAVHLYYVSCQQLHPDGYMCPVL